jgi:hypothetical protein
MDEESRQLTLPAADLPFMTTIGAPSSYHPQQHQAQDHLQHHQTQTYNAATPVQAHAYIHKQGPPQAPPQIDEDEYGEFPPLPVDMDFEGMY